MPPKNELITIKVYYGKSELSFSCWHVAGSHAAIQSKFHVELIQEWIIETNKLLITMKSNLQS